MVVAVQGGGSHRSSPPSHRRDHAAATPHIHSPPTSPTHPTTHTLTLHHPPNPLTSVLLTPLISKTPLTSPTALTPLQENEPDIYHAIQFGTILENVVFDEETRHVDYDVNSITENTRASYPIEHIGACAVQRVWGACGVCESVWGGSGSFCVHGILGRFRVVRRWSRVSAGGRIT